MMKPFKRTVKWHTEGREHYELQGELEYSLNDGIGLRCSYSFDSKTLPEEKDFDTIYANTDDGKKVSLFDNLMCNNVPETFSKSQMNCNYRLCILGNKHIQDLENEKFSEMVAKFSSYRLWTQNEFFKVENIIYKHDDVESAFSICTDKHDCSKLLIIPKKPQNYNWFSEVSFKIRALLTIFIGISIYYDELSLKASSDNESFQVFFMQRNYRSNIVLYPDDIFVQLSQEANSIINESFRFWFKNSLILEPIIRAISAVISEHENTIEVLFWLMITALEGWISWKAFNDKLTTKYVDNQKWDENYLKVFIDSIPVDTESDFKNSLKARLKFLNEYSLKRKVLEFLKTLPGSLKDVVIPEDQKSFCSKVADTRNYLDHYAFELVGKAASGKQIYVISEKLRLLLIYSILAEFGFSESFLLKAMRKDPTFEELYKKVQEQK